MISSSAGADEQMVTTDGHLLGGRVSYRQPAAGFRSGIEPVLLAASIPARKGQHVLEAGTGAGAALLCLNSRVSGICATGVETDSGLAALAALNARHNGFAGIEIVTGRLEDVALPRLFDHAMANPPYHQPDGPASPLAARETAKRGSDTLIRNWIGRLSSVLRHRGSLTLIVPAGLIPVCLAAMTERHCPGTAIFPLWPMPGRQAKLVLLRGVRDGRTRMRLMPGLVLHQPNGSFSTEAQAILAGGGALSLDG